MADRERSPNYPALDLPSAVALTKMLWQKEGRSQMSMPALAQALGSTSDGLSGPFRSKIAALRQYGLIDKAGVGKAKLSPRGVTIGLRSQDDPGYWEAIQEAALAPSLFQDLWARFSEGGSDTNIRNFLVEDKGFALAGAERAVRAFRETVAFAKLDASSYNEPDDAAAAEDKLETPRVQPGPVMARLFSAEERNEPPSRPTSEGRVSLNWLLSDKVPVRVIFDADPTPRAVDRLIGLLQFLKDDLAAEQHDKIGDNGSQQIVGDAPDFIDNLEV